MHPAAPAQTLSPSSWTPLLLGCVAGAAWQVTQPRLWPLWMYLLLAGMGLAGLAWRGWRGWGGPGGPGGGPPWGGGDGVRESLYTRPPRQYHCRFYLLLK